MIGALRVKIQDIFELKYGTLKLSLAAIFFFLLYESMKDKVYIVDLMLNFRSSEYVTFVILYPQTSVVGVTVFTLNIWTAIAEQTLQTLIRLLLRSSLIWACNVCHYFFASM